VNSVRIVQLDPATLRALAAGERPDGLSAWLAGPDNRSLWLRRHRQVSLDPAEAAWVTGVVRASGLCWPDAAAGPGRPDAAAGSRWPDAAAGPRWREAAAGSRWPDAAAGSRWREAAAGPGRPDAAAGSARPDAAETAVGRAGFHGAPDENGMVEVGYAIDPAYRRRGYARAALAFLLDRAAREPAVRTVRASVRPDNHASRALIESTGFVPVGQQWDDEDGLETVYERPA
jgi:RimJ/RimL family protein N-acetyltransferase